MTSPRESNELHRRADTDSGALAIHHTLGYRPNQAAPGNHSHNGVDSQPLGLENYLLRDDAEDLYLKITTAALEYEPLVTPVAVSGSRSSGEALQNLLAALATLGFIQDNTSA